MSIKYTYTIRDLSTDGRGVAKREDGRVVFINGALPGDTVIAQTVQSPSKGPLEGEVELMIAPSPDRIEHLCTHHKEGCPASPLGSLDLAAGMMWKEHHLRETLKRIGKVQDSVMITPLYSPLDWEYRERIELHLEWKKGKWQLGYQSRNGLRLINRCLLAMPSIQAASEKLVKALEEGRLEPPEGRWQRGIRLLLRDNGKGKHVAVLFIVAARPFDATPFAKWLNAANLAGWQVRQIRNVKSRFLKSRVVMSSGDPTIYHTICADYLNTPPTVFSQANRSASETLLDVVSRYLPEEGLIADLYGGFGFFALNLAQEQRPFIVVESAHEAIKAGKQFAKRQNLPVEHIKGDLAGPSNLLIDFKKLAGVIVDPPRTGLHQFLATELNKNGPQSLVYVSCHPAALARDLKRLSNYEPRHFYLVDLFPQTPEMETVAVLDRRKTD